MKVGSLFSGIGGLDLGLERAGMEVAWQSEIDPYCCRVLAKHWPGIPNLGDVTTVDWSTVERVDLICGGYPCQPFSLAGRRGGADDPRHLWPHFRDALRELRPRYALLENVPGHLTLGFPEVLADLAALGFDAEWSIVSAADVGAPHLRRRLFVVAYASGARRWEDARGALGDEGADAWWATEDHHVADGDGEGGRAGHVADTASERRGSGVFAWADMVNDGQEPAHSDAGAWRDWWAAEPDVGRVAHGVPARVDRLRALGNAVVPQVAEWIGRRVMEMA
jgi:DNA (cytosine-5)-methyltransferase 1